MVAALACVRERDTVDRHTDSIGVCVDPWTSQYVHLIGGAINAVTPSVKHHVCDKVTFDRKHEFDYPFAASSEPCISTLGGKITMVGALEHSQINQFDRALEGYTANSWYQINSDFSGSLGSLKMAFCGDIGDYFYIGGGLGQDHFFKTHLSANFREFTDLGLLPANIRGVAACGYCVHKGKLYVVGGGTSIDSPYGIVQFRETSEVNGYVYRLDPATDTWELVATCKTECGSLWLDLGSGADGNLYLSAGYLRNQHLASFAPATPMEGNQDAFYKSTDDGATWSTMSQVDSTRPYICRPETHRASALTIDGEVHFICGNMLKSVWKVTG